MVGPSVHAAVAIDANERRDHYLRLASIALGVLIIGGTTLLLLTDRLRRTLA